MVSSGSSISPSFPTFPPRNPSNFAPKIIHFRPKIRPREEIPSSLTCPDHPDLLPDHPDTSRISWTLSRTSEYPTHPENRTGADEPGSSGCTPGSSGPSPDHPDLLPDVRLTLTLLRLKSCFDRNFHIRSPIYAFFSSLSSYLHPLSI